jgi:hypothetical protein
MMTINTTSHNPGYQCLLNYVTLRAIVTPKEPVTTMHDSLYMRSRRARARKVLHSQRILYLW